MAASKLFPNALAQALAGNIKTSDTWKMILVTSAYAFATTQVHYSDVSADEVATANGYTAGGTTLTSPAVAVTAAASWPATWAASTAYSVGQVRVPATGTGYVYQCVVAGTSGTTSPAFPTVFGETVTDGTVTWVNAGESVVAVSAGAASWTLTGSVSANGAILYDAATGVATTDPLICYINFGSTQTGSTSFSVTPDANLGYISVTPA